MSNDPVAVEVNELINELSESFLPLLDEKKEVCAPMLIQKGYNKWSVLRRLGEQADSGKLVWRWALWNGKKVKAYRKA